MSKHNYTQYSNNKTEKSESVIEKSTLTSEEPEVKINETIEAPEIKLVNETVETVTLPETVEGVVSNCLKLNVRVAPHKDATVACIIIEKSKVEIDVAKSTEEWYAVKTVDGIEGYCMKRFINARL